MTDFMQNVREKQELIMAGDKVGRWGFSLTVMEKTVPGVGLGTRSLNSDLNKLSSGWLSDFKVEQSGSQLFI